MHSYSDLNFNAISYNIHEFQSTALLQNVNAQSGDNTFELNCILGKDFVVEKKMMVDQTRRKAHSFELFLGITDVVASTWLTPNKRINHAELEPVWINAV